MKLGPNLNTTFFVSFADSEPPVFTNCPSDYNLVTDAEGKFNYPTWERVGATDNSGNEPSVTTDFRFKMFQLNTRTRIEYVASDDYGNNQTCVFHVSVTGEFKSWRTYLWVGLVDGGEGVDIFP